MRQRDKGTFQMLWDCPRCESRGLLGVTHRFCPACGAPQDPGSRYFPSDDQKVALEDHRFVGADWICQGCDTPNAQTATHCGACGAPREKAKDAEVRGAQSSDTSGQFEEDSARDAREEARARRHAREGQGEAEPPPDAPAPSSRRRGLFTFLLIGGAVLAAVLVVLFWKRDATVTVQGLSWERTIAVEVYGPVSQGAWRDQLPSAAYNVSCAERVRDYRQVPDGETCTTRRIDQGDGSFREVEECSTRYRREPITDQYCHYTLDVWHEDRKLRAAGKGKVPAPHWPEVVLHRTGDCLGCEREGDRDDDYLAAVAEAGEDAQRCSLPEEKWSSLEVGQALKTRARVLTGGIDCDRLEAATDTRS